MNELIAKNFLNKNITIIKIVNNDTFFFHGLVKNVSSDGILIFSEKFGLEYHRFNEITEIKEGLI